MASAVLAAVVSASMLASCGPLPVGFRQEVVAGGLTLPTAWVQPADPAIQYIAEKAGAIRVVSAGRVRANPLVDLSARVHDQGDRGLVGLALDPQFQVNGHLYLAYTYEDPEVPIDQPEQSQRVSRITVDLASHTADPASEEVVLGRVTGAACYDAWETPDCLPSSFAVHTVGDLAFDGQGLLWVSVGDGAIPPYTPDEVSYRAQDVDVLAGKLLRIDPATGEGVPGNPFYDAAAPGSNASRVYAYGFRNPFRFTFRPGSGTPYVGDVGGGVAEEIDVVRPGGNYGWPCYEGAAKHRYFSTKPVCQPMYQAATPVIAPATSYPHDDQGSSITGGVFYRGGSYPAEYTGDYVYGDYNAFVRRQDFTAAD
ncbi:MAG TPA: PQQ-dependent sugar dehydrogenase, partial [Aquihabitans sp.]|nr:PQQ-dependent sugar dehydrogenase [Aquihabitans sp.]